MILGRRRKKGEQGRAGRWDLVGRARGLDTQGHGRRGRRDTVLALTSVMITIRRGRRRLVEIAWEGWCRRSRR